MRRRGVGIGAVQGYQQATQKFQQVGEILHAEQLSHVQEQLRLFKDKLQQFAMTHKESIKKDPEFRTQFQNMCSKIGVDPLASNKGFWSELLDVGDFYYELGVQIIEIGILTRSKNGGLLAMQELLRLLDQKRGKYMQKVSEDDVRRSVKKLKILGNGFNLLELAGQPMIVTVPMALSSDHTLLLSMAQDVGGVVDVQKIEEKLGWDVNRSQIALNVLLREGMTWMDTQTSTGYTAYYFPSIVFSRRTSQ